MSVKICPPPLSNEVYSVLQQNLFAQPLNVAEWYAHLRSGSVINTSLQIHHLHPELQALLNSKTDLKNCGIDLPVWFGDLNSEQRLLIVALDPKRNQTVTEITLGSVFSLHTSEGRSTRRNNYWNFIEPLTKQGFVYITDIFKIYYEARDSTKGKTLLSNKDLTHINPEAPSGKLYKSILEKEIALVRPTRIITLGNEAASVIKKIRNIRTSNLNYLDSTAEYIFLPHISNTVTQNIKTIGNLFLGIGLIKRDESLRKIGLDILDNREYLF